MLRWTKDDASLLAMTNEVDYDQDGKCSSFCKLKEFHSLYHFYIIVLSKYLNYFSVLSTVGRYDSRKNRYVYIIEGQGTKFPKMSQ